MREGKTVSISIGIVTKVQIRRDFNWYMCSGKFTLRENYWHFYLAIVFPVVRKISSTVIPESKVVNDSLDSDNRIDIEWVDQSISSPGIVANLLVWQECRTLRASQQKCFGQFNIHFHCLC